MKLCVVGTGYVGLVSAACFAEMGNDVHCVDVNENVVRSLEEGRIHIFEPGLEDLVNRSYVDKRLFFSTDLASSLDGAAVVFLCVGTPSAKDGSCDLRYIMGAAREIGMSMNAPLVVVDKSTVPVGTADAVHSVISEAQAERGISIPFFVVSNPEFLKEGDAINDFMKPDRIILGTGSEEAETLMRELYAPFAMNKEKILVTSVRSAEMIKYAANGMLATKISFINEIAQICEHVGADVRDVRTGIGTDRRIGPHFIYPGLGYGGSCFPKDVRALIHTARTAGLEPELLAAVDSVNNRQKQHMAGRILEYFDAQGGVAGKTLALWGLAFKANTDDMRESPVLPIIERLCKEGMRIRAFDPIANNNARKIFTNETRLSIEDDQYGVLEGADALLLATEWNQFRTPDFNRIKSLLHAPVIFDGRNLYSGKTVAGYGFAYFCIGRR
ncbi:UDP-glucose/GDP-mannose dehydrogenase family protein [Desulfovibrio sp. OttesenSCG-928-G15]|nr:UDP-glucose/GDP-mannose dehydrogenase family protein [Desulfovibrio sp. OttesenSCG-928-G15]